MTSTLRSSQAFRYRPECLVGLCVATDRKRAAGILHGEAERRHRVHDIDGMEIAVINRNRIAGATDVVTKHRVMRDGNFAKSGQITPLNR